MLAQLPPIAPEVRNLLLPALLANYIVKKPKLVLSSVPLALIMVMLHNAGAFAFLKKLGTPLVVLTSVFGTMTFGIVMAKKANCKAPHSVHTRDAAVLF